MFRDGILGSLMLLTGGLQVHICQRYKTCPFLFITECSYRDNSICVTLPKQVIKLTHLDIYFFFSNSTGKHEAQTMYFTPFLHGTIFKFLRFNLFYHIPLSAFSMAYPVQQSVPLYLRGNSKNKNSAFYIYKEGTW